MKCPLCDRTLKPGNGVSMCKNELCLFYAEPFTNEYWSQMEEQLKGRDWRAVDRFRNSAEMKGIIDLVRKSAFEHGCDYERKTNITLDSPTEY